MATAAENYLDAVRRILDHIQTTQLPTVDKIAVAIADSVTSGGAVWVADIGHGNDRDFLNRAGGLACVHHLGFGVSTDSEIAECRRNRPRPDDYNEEAETVRAGLRASQVRSGDVLLISSVSGRNTRPIEITLAAREMGVTVVAMTSLAYTANVEPLHRSGKKLCDAANIVLDVGCPYGDAAVDIPGYPCKLVPLSGVGMIVLGWCVWSRVMEILAERGTPASVFKSINGAGGQEFYDAQIKQYNERGF